MTHTQHIKSLAITTSLLAIITVAPLLVGAANPSRDKVNECRYEAQQRYWDERTPVQTDYWNARAEIQRTYWESMGNISHWRWDGRDAEYDERSDLLRAWSRNQDGELRSAYRKTSNELRKIYREELYMCRRYGEIKTNPWERFEGLEFEMGPAINLNPNPTNPTYPNVNTTSAVSGSANVNPNVGTNPGPTVTPSTYNGATPAVNTGGNVTPNWQSYGTVE